MAAARLKTLSRCWPKVVPVFPATAARGEGSLKPSPAPSLLTMLIVAALADFGTSAGKICSIMDS